MRRKTHALVCLGAWLTLSSGVHAYVPAETQLGASLWWDAQEIPFVLDANTPEGWDDQETLELIEEAFARWSTLDCYPMTFPILGYDEGALEADDGTNWIRWVHEDWPYSSSLIALTSIHALTATGQILDADIEVNLADKAFITGFECNPNQNGYDLLGTLVHEIGHVLGAGHSREAQATMYGVTTWGDCTKATLHQDDVDGFCANYTDRVATGSEPPPSPDSVEADVSVGHEDTDTITKPPKGCEMAAQDGRKHLLSLLIAWVLGALYCLRFARQARPRDHREP